MATLLMGNLQNKKNYYYTVKNMKASPEVNLFLPLVGSSL